ncbi:helix-turn-helix domain-containing protein [Caulobacter segnis]|jgi:AraC family transcriptional regulator|uniref:helix-turn-helix domain-containing protein n=1 Tax=Caulobacter segnis TaxID=88688 RepID=UPI001CBDD3F6|nr:AraC family transcriptional regulator [Caulobacter segnis]UAL12410.1 AraC family transcriptional regulator [Caulobacter segnis]
MQELGGLLPWQIKRVRGYLDDRLDGRIRMASVAEQARLSPSYFSRRFRQCFGVTFAKFIARMRVERAQRLMMTSPLSLSHIALACGFADQAHFTRTFSALTGSTPAQWRREALLSASEARWRKH